MWVKRTTNSNHGGLLRSPDGTVKLTSANNVALSDHASATDHMSTYTVPLNTWTHLTLVATASDTKIYADGALQGTINASIPLPMAAIGHGNNHALAGKLDELKIWDEALTVEQVADVYRSHCAEGLVHHWSFDVGSGSTATDAGSGGADGTVTGASWVSEGRVGGALSFDGAGDFVQVGAAAVPVGGVCGGWSAALWVKRTADRGDAVLFAPASKARGNVVVKLEQWRRDNKVGISRLGRFDHSFDYVTPLNTWTHLALVSTATDTKLYANGVLRGTLSYGIDLPLHRIGAFAPGGSGGVAAMSAVLDDVRVYGSALDVAGVVALFAEEGVEPPGVPGEVTLTPADGELTVRWLAPTDDGGWAVNGYVVEHKAATDTVWTAASVVGARSHSISSLANGTVYEVRVAATNPAGSGVFSPVASAEVSAMVVAPGVPRGLAVTPASRELTITWVAPGSDGGAEVTGYKVQHKETGGEWGEAGRSRRRCAVSHHREPHQRHHL